MTPDEFLIEHYRLAVGYLTTQYERLWQRFSFFISVHTALFGFLAWLVFDKGQTGAIAAVAAAGTFLSVLWYVVAAQDLYLVARYRDRVSEAAEKIQVRETFGWPGYSSVYVGAPVPTSNAKDFKWYEWYSRSISILRLPVWIAVSVALIWVCLLIYGLVQP